MPRHEQLTFIISRELTKVYDGLRTTVSAIHGEQKKQIDRMKTNTERIEKVEKELSSIK